MSTEQRAKFEKIVDALEEGDAALIFQPNGGVLQIIPGSNPETGMAVVYLTLHWAEVDGKQINEKLREYLEYALKFGPKDSDTRESLETISEMLESTHTIN